MDEETEDFPPREVVKKRGKEEGREEETALAGEETGRNLFIFTLWDWWAEGREETKNKMEDKSLKFLPPFNPPPASLCLVLESDSGRGGERLCERAPPPVSRPSQDCSWYRKSLCSVSSMCCAEAGWTVGHRLGMGRDSKSSQLFPGGRALCGHDWGHGKGPKANLPIEPRCFGGLN